MTRTEAEKNKADLRKANLYGADLSGADLSGADLYEANLSGANLYRADLRKANLRRANLSEANLYEADLRRADLYEANLYEANLYRADLSGAKNISKLILAKTIIVTEGDLVGWKKCSDGVIVKLRIPMDAKRSNATGRKCRAEFAEVLEVYGAEKGISTYREDFVYERGTRVTCDKWNEDRFQECSGGIHFFLTRIEAENY
jgi:hypothetical protein